MQDILKIVTDSGTAFMGAYWILSSIN